MIKREEVYQIGRLGRPHGIKGELSFQFSDDVFDRTDADYLVIETEGILVPFFMEEYRFRNDSVALVKFCDIDTQERAAELTNCDVFFPRSLTPDEDNQPTMAMLVGFHIVDTRSKKTVGKVAAIDESTANTLFELEDGTLIPATDALVRQIDTKQQIITMDIPKGLLEL